jgi:hypothetical protein
MIAGSRDLLARVDATLARGWTRSSTHPRSPVLRNRTARAQALAKADECERLARQAASAEQRVVFLETRQLWIEIAYLDIKNQDVGE